MDIARYSSLLCRRSVFFALLCCPPLAAQTNTKGQAVVDDQIESTSDPQTPPDWATDFLAEDPLAGKESLTLQDLEQALEDEGQRQSVIKRHFLRAALTPPQQREFLLSAFQHPDMTVRSQAAEALHQLGELQDVVRSTLLEWMENGDRDLAESAIIGLQFLRIPEEQLDSKLFDSLLAALASESPRVRAAAAAQLERLGPTAIPILLKAMQDPQQPQQDAAEVLSRIVGEVPAEIEAVQKVIAPPEEVTKSAAVAAASDMLARQVDEDQAEVVRVYYGTNREISQLPKNPQQSLAIWGSVFFLTVGIAVWSFTRSRPKESSWLGYMLRRAITALLLFGVVAFSAMQCNAALRDLASSREGVQFGGHRSQNRTIYYGYCDVSIPPTHSVGVVERPLIGPEDEAKHVILKQAALLEQAAFYDAVNEVLDGADDTSRDCLLYVHGYNVAFDDAAQRAAQIHYDLKFAGTTMFYSWPSRASTHHYFSDRNEIGFSHTLIKEFLAGMLDNLDVDRFHVVAHSMGADAVCQAILELDPEGEVFDQIVLAAPDIDADVFKQTILPRLQKCGHRTTLYCSKHDWALHASKHFNDSLRAGDSSMGPLVAIGLDTIDASEMDTELLGHSYYGNCLRLLDDLRLLLELNRPPAERKLEPLFDVPETPYWRFID